MKTDDHLLNKIKALKFYGLLAHWDEIRDADWLEQIVAWEEIERAHRSLERRLANARIGDFKPLANFDWDWPKECDRGAIEDLMKLEFIKDSTNVIFCGPNGVGKSTITRNITHQAIHHGYTALFTSAGEMLNELAAQDGDNALRRRLKHYSQPDLLVIDEVGYLSYSNRHADLLFEIVSRRYEKKPVIITTNRPFGEWGDIFPNAASVVSLIDRLIHNSEILSIDAESYRLKEAKENTKKRKEARNKRRKSKEKTSTSINDNIES
tara:strand:+ start:2274 stop:3071 length:798 start_codon:yes stop_codon:yes gene_type:complete